MEKASEEKTPAEGKTTVQKTAAEKDDSEKADSQEKKVDKKKAEEKEEPSATPSPVASKSDLSTSSSDAVDDDVAEKPKTSESGDDSAVEKPKKKKTLKELTDSSTDEPADLEEAAAAEKKKEVRRESRFADDVEPLPVAKEKSKKLGDEATSAEGGEEGDGAVKRSAEEEQPTEEAENSDVAEEESATPSPSATPSASPTATPTPVKPQEMMKFGLILPLTGPSAVWGKLMQNAANLAFEELEPDVQKKMGLIFEDDQMRGPVATSAFRKLNETDHVKGIVVFGAQSVTALAPLVEKAEIPMFAITANKDSVDGKLYSFRHWLDASEQIKTMVPFMKEHDVRTISVVLVAHEAMQDYISKFAVAAAQENIEIVSKDEIAAQQETDFKDIVTRIKETAPDAVLIALLPPQISVFAKKMRDLGADSPMFGFAPIETMSEVKAAAGAMDGFIYTAPKLSKEFVKRFQDRYDSFPELAAANVFDMVKMWGAAVKAGANDAKSVTTSIRKIKDFPGVMGTYSITENNNFSVKADLKKIKRGSFRKLDEN